MSETEYQKSLDMMEAALRVKDKEVTSMKAAEKTRVRIASAWLTQQACIIFN